MWTDIKCSGKISGVIHKEIKTKNKPNASIKLEKPHKSEYLWEMKYNKRRKTNRKVEFLIMYLDIISNQRFHRRFYTPFYSKLSSLYRNELEKFNNFGTKTSYKRHFKGIAEAAISRSAELEKEWGRNKKIYTEKPKQNPKRIPIKFKDLEESIKYFIYY